MLHKSTSKTTSGAVMELRHHYFDWKIFKGFRKITFRNLWKLKTRSFKPKTHIFFGNFPKVPNTHLMHL